MKKILAIVLAGVLTLGMSVTAFADNTSNLDGSTTSTGADINAKIVPVISATVSWGDMNFTFLESDYQWDANGTNEVTVTNTGLARSIDTSYSYAQNGGKGETTMIAGWVEDNDQFFSPGNRYDVSMNEYYGNNFNTPTKRALNALGTTLAPNAEQKFWLTFTTADNLGTLTTTSAKVGTLTITIAAH